jgi:hypothetical protein
MGQEFILSNMTARQNTEDVVECPVSGCDEEVLARGLFMHIFQSDDPEGENHYPRFEIPPEIDAEDVKVTGEQQVNMDYPDEQRLEDDYYLDTYTGKAYEGRRGLMVHLGQKAGSDNIPEDVTERHEADDFPVVEIDDDGNVIEVIQWPQADVPALEPYLSWKTDEDQGYVSKQRIRQFVEKVRNSTTGAASAEAIEEALLKQ